jgi:phosphatidylserine/phosphatidylglycerophosphate/cardiolipin synthase-like enzyme
MAPILRRLKMIYRTYFDIPNDNRKHIKGSSPNLTKNFIEEIQGAKNIYISFFLFNNPIIQKELEKLSEQGCKIKIYSLPLQGYDNRSKVIYYKNFTKTISTSKHEYAEKIYKRIRKNKNMELKIFPHTYVWFKQKFSRGKEAYSLHNKSVLAEFENDVIKCISSSCNFALGDPRHTENMLVVENCYNTISMFKTYFKLIDKYSLTVEDYEDFSKTSYDFEYIIQPMDLKDTYNSCYFSAPFIKYNGLGSNHYIQKIIIDLISNAKDRIFICAQHISDIDSFDKNALSIVDAIKGVIDKNPEIEIKLLKQTRSTNQVQGARTYATELLFNAFNNVEQKYWSPVIHDKFVIVDKKVLVSTSNFTSTQFAWSENHPMKYEVNGENRVVMNTFSEVNSFHFIENISVTESYESHFKGIWEKASYLTE